MLPQKLFKIIIFILAFLPNLNGQKLEYNSEKDLQTFKFNDQNRTAPFSYVGKRNSEYETHGFETLGTLAILMIISALLFSIRWPPAIICQTAHANRKLDTNSIQISSNNNLFIK